jgi:hypothetical protein
MSPTTGRAAGFWAGFGMPGYANPAPGRGFGPGWGRGFGGGGHGWRHWFHATGLPGWMRFAGYNRPYQQPDPESERQALRNCAEELQSELDGIRKRLDELETTATKRAD